MTMAISVRNYWVYKVLNWLTFNDTICAQSTEKDDFNLEWFNQTENTKTSIRKTKSNGYFFELRMSSPKNRKNFELDPL